MKERSDRSWERATAGDLLGFLRAKHDGRDGGAEWIYLEELRTATGNERITAIDAWAMNTMPFKNLQRIAYEVKVSYGDFRREIRNPAKRKIALMYSNLFYFVTPPGLIPAAEVPAEAGLMEFDAEGVQYVKVLAPWRDSIQPSWQFLASVQRQIKAGADDRALARLGHIKLQHAASLEDRTRRQEEAEERARVAWYAVRRDETVAQSERIVIDQARRELGLMPLDWRRLVREEEERRDSDPLSWSRRLRNY